MKLHCLSCPGVVIAHHKSESSLSPAFPGKQKGRTLLTLVLKIWWPLLGLNQRPSDYESENVFCEISNLLILLNYLVADSDI